MTVRDASQTDPTRKPAIAPTPEQDSTTPTPKNEEPTTPTAMQKTVSRRKSDGMTKNPAAAAQKIMETGDAAGTQSALSPAKAADTTLDGLGDRVGDEGGILLAGFDAEVFLEGVDLPADVPTDPTALVWAFDSSTPPALPDASSFGTLKAGAIDDIKKGVAEIWGNPQKYSTYAQTQSQISDFVWAQTFQKDQPATKRDAERCGAAAILYMVHGAFGNRGVLAIARGLHKNIARDPSDAKLKKLGYKPPGRWRQRFKKELDKLLANMKSGNVTAENLQWLQEAMFAVISRKQVTGDYATNAGDVAYYLRQMGFGGRALGRMLMNPRTGYPGWAGLWGNALPKLSVGQAMMLFVAKNPSHFVTVKRTKHGFALYDSLGVPPRRQYCLVTFPTMKKALEAAAQRHGVPVSRVLGVAVMPNP